MTNAEVQTLLESANCYGCYDLSLSERLELALLRQWLMAVNPSADTSGATLLASVSCVACLGASVFELLVIALLSAINDAI